MQLARRSIQAVVWNSATNIARIGILLVRSILLARLLDPEVFGIYAFGVSIIGLSSTLLNFGMDGAFLFRAPETENENHAAATHFTLTILIALFWGIAMLLFGFFWLQGNNQLVVIVLTVTTIARQVTQTPRLILTRRVVHRRLATLQMVNNFLIAGVAIVLAWQGQTIWALLSTNIVPLFLSYIWLYVWKPVWRPRLRWQPDEIRYFIQFGTKNMFANMLVAALDRVDDLWTGIYLGEGPLGFYSRAYAFAGYPQAILAAPIDTVAGGTFAELKNNRKKLSMAFFRVNALLIRSSFFMGGIIALAAPEFIEIVLGAKWLPMLDAFRLMLIFTLFDPLQVVISNLFIANGVPEKLVRVRLLQLGILGIGLVTLGYAWGIAGVALAVDIMLVVGIFLLLWQAQRYVDFSWKKLFLMPVLGIVPAMLLAFLVLQLPFVLHTNWYTGAVKVIVFATVYAGIFLIFEPEYIIKGINLVRSQLFPQINKA
jgi:PST family polysaccharide transporter